MTTKDGQLVIATLSALAAAAVMLLTVILPAEYGWDPLGTGDLLGLTGLSVEDANALANEPGAWQSDAMAFELPPFASVEYKYRLEQGQTLLFEWQSDGEVVVDMHGEPDGAAPGYAESFRQSRGRRNSGSYRAPFSGVHGWFFQNRGETDVTVSLETQGFYSHAIEYSEGRELRRNF